MREPNPILADPQALTPDDAPEHGPEDGRALCVSGGGYRTMQFHCGTLWALHDHGWLPRLDRISGVSGGSMTAAVLGLAWQELLASPATKGDFEAKVAQPIRRLARMTIDVPSVPPSCPSVVIWT